MADRKTFFFCGIGGSGMSAIAQVLRQEGQAVRGSDRGPGTGGRTGGLYEALAAQEIALYAQDGSGMDREVDEVGGFQRGSRRRFRTFGRRCSWGYRSGTGRRCWRGCSNRGEGVAVGGTSGKTTVTGMVGHILREAGRNPTVINGGIMLNAADPPFLGNAICGDSNLPVIEADEHDGTIALYHPAVAVLTNISLDHKSLEELRPLFREFCMRARKAAVVNLDCTESAALIDEHPNRVTFRDGERPGGLLRRGGRGVSGGGAVPGERRGVPAAGARPGTMCRTP